MIRSFFQQLANYYLENNLSDITLYICNCSKLFRVLFINSIFPILHESDINKIINIEREFTSEDGEARIDFKFEIDNQIYLIENKIYDRDYHFSQYLKSYKNSIIGFIANYNVIVIDIYEFKVTWNEVYNKLQNALHEMAISEERSLLSGYAEYLKKVCCIMDRRDFSPSKSSDINYLNNIFDELIKKYSNSELGVNNKAKGCMDYRSGKYFYSCKDNSKNFWVGIYTTDYSNNIIIEFLNAEFSLFNPVNGKYYKKPYLEENSVWFELKDIFLLTLNDSNVHFIEKHKIIEEYFNEVIKLIESTF
jgi:hypothetical protein